MRRKLLAEARHILRRPVQAVHRFQCFRRIPGPDRVGQREKVLAPHQTDRLGNDLLGHIPAAAEALVQDGKRVAQRPVRQAGDQQRSLRGKLRILLPGDVGQPVRDVLRRNAVEIEALAAREDRRGKLVHLRGGEDKDDMRRRLFQRFQERVERADGKHVHLVDDINAVLRGSRRKIRLLAKGADILDAVVAGRVDFHNVEDGAVLDAAADLAFAAGVPVRGAQAVHGLGQDLGAGCFSRSAGTGK